MDSTAKFCIDCETWKSAEDFHRDRSNPDGRQSYCKPCQNARGAASHARKRSGESPPLASPRPRLHAEKREQRFWALVDRSGGPDACWLWTGGKAHDRPNPIGIEGKYVDVRRYAYSVQNGLLDRSESVRSRCRDPFCVNGKHLLAVGKNGIIGGTSKFCCVCREVKPLDGFGQLKKSPSGRAFACKDCRSDRHQAYQYEVRQSEYNRMLAEQNGGCAICGGAATRRRFCIDHDHRTGSVRGLLCDTCNAGIGMLRDDPKVLLSAVAYLEGFSESSGAASRSGAIRDALAR